MNKKIVRPDINDLLPQERRELASNELRAHPVRSRHTGGILKAMSSYDRTSTDMDILLNIFDRNGQLRQQVE